MDDNDEMDNERDDDVVEGDVLASIVHSTRWYSDNQAVKCHVNVQMSVQEW